MIRNSFRQILLISFEIILILLSCTSFGQTLLNTNEMTHKSIEFKRGDILVRPNSNWLPGTSYVPDGSGFGHAVIVLKGSSGYDPEKVLAETEIMESHSRDVPPEFQIRTIKGFKEDADINYANISFGNQYKGIRYRLRAELPEEQIEKVIEYIINQDPDKSSWRAKKNTSNVPEQKHYWYCSLLIYQAFKDVLDIDLDTNDGFTVFPNDLIVNPMFDHETGRMIF